MRACAARVASVLLLLLATGCPLPWERTVEPERDRTLLDEILAREGARDLDPSFFATMLAHPSPHVRRAAARALGRIQSPSAVPLLVERTLDAGESPRVLEECAFALGQLRSVEAFPALESLARHASWQVRANAVEAIGKLEGELTGAVRLLLAAGLEDAHEGVRGTAALACWRRQDASAIPALARRLDPAEPGPVRWRAAYALMRLPAPETLPVLRPMLADPDPWVRTFAAWGMRNPHDPEAIEPLGQLLADPASPWQARVQALITLKELRARKLGDPARIRTLLLEQLPRSLHPLEGQALMEAIGEGGGDEECHALTAVLVNDPAPSVRRSALVALGRVGGARVLARIEPHLLAKDPWERAAAASALGYCGDEGAKRLEGLLDPGREPDGRVRAAAVRTLATLESWELIFGCARRDPDGAARGDAVDAIIAGKPEGWAAALAGVYDGSAAHEFWELRLSILNALEGEKALREPLLERAAADPVPSIRAVARSASGAGTAVAAGADAKARAREPYTLIRREHLYGGEPPHIILETSRGRIVLELYLDAAPRHVSNILQLTRRGFYDGLLFHRVVPSFVVQGGDPLGHGWGDAGYFLPDEINDIPFERGTLGMPKAARDDGSCQIFITHLPTPHLDGRYTVFGRVVLGMEVIDRIEVGEPILRMRVDEGRLRPESR